MSKSKIPLAIRCELRELKDKLEALADPKNERCSVDPKAKEAARIYLRSWCTPAVQRILDWADGELEIKDWPYWGK